MQSIHFVSKALVKVAENEEREGNVTGTPKERNIDSIKDQRRNG